MGNTIELLRRRVAGHDTDTAQGTAQIAPYVRVRREFALDLDWSLQTTVERLAPEKGGFTLEVPSEAFGEIRRALPGPLPQ